MACNAAVLLKKFSGEEGERVDVQKLFGYIGLFTLVALWWLGKNLYHSCLVYAYFLCVVDNEIFCRIIETIFH